jgi:hypothetical protein
LWAGALSCKQEKISRAKRSWTNPLNALQEAIRYSFTKTCIYCFSLWYKFFVHYALRVEKNYQQGLDAGPLEFQFLRPRICADKRGSGCTKIPVILKNPKDIHNGSPLYITH